VSHPLRTRFVGPAAVIDLEGDLSHESEAALLTALHDAHVAPRTFLLLNFKDCGYINSAGISVLVSIIAENRDGAHRLLACSLSPHYQKIFRMVGLGPFLPIYEDETAALQAIEDTH
jgi:anti-anti-sigma factor